MVSSQACITLDVVLLLPGRAREQAVSSSKALAHRMAANGYPSHFRLGEPYPAAAGGVCEPHVSLFMLAVTPAEIPAVVDAVRGVARVAPPLRAAGDEYRHNPHGAPEMYFARSPAWTFLQRSVIKAVEPLRRGRLREVGPAGDNLRAVVDGRLPSHPAAVAQLARYGYDEVADAGCDRFNPHVTLAWPDDPSSRVDLMELPPAQVYSGVLTELAVYGMSPYGTCTVGHATFPLHAPASLAAAATGDDRPGIFETAVRAGKNMIARPLAT